MIGAIAKAIGSVGKAAGSAGKFGSETMEGIRPTVESVAKVAAPRMEIPRPLSGPPKEFVSGLKTKGDSGPHGVKSALKDLSTFEGNNSTTKEEIGEVEKLKREIEEQRRSEKRRELKNDLVETLTPPTYGPGEEPAHIISKNLEELPQALGESTTNTPVTNPR